MATVNRPTDPKIKEKDINQKLQLYGIFSAFSNGKVPSNKQIDVALNSALAHRSLSSPSQKLSAEGRELVQDLREVIKQAKYLMLTKNEGNLLQDFIWQTQGINAANTSLPGAPTDKATAQQHGNEALDGLRTLGTLLLSNGQFRKLLTDASVLLRDIAGDAATNVAGRVKPSEDQLSQIDKPAEDNTWHDVPSRGDIRGSIQEQYNKQKPFSRSDAKEAAGSARDAAQSRPETNQPADQLSQQEGARVGQEGASAGADHLKQKASENVPDETKDKARNVANRGKAYLGDKMPAERREQTIWRLKKMIVEIQGHSDYQEAIETLLSLAETYGGHTRSLTQGATGTVKGAHDDGNLQKAEADLKLLLERFANSTSSDDIFDSIDAIYRDADKDPELKNWFKSLDKFVRRCLQEQGYVLKDEVNREWDGLYDKGHFLLRERYRDHTNRIIDEFKFFGDQFDQDPQNKAFGHAVQKLFLDLGNDENGKPMLKTHLITDLTDVIVPAIFENTRYIPIPRIEISDPMIDAVVENLVIESDNIAPNMLEFGSDNYFRWGRKSISNKRETKIMISGSGIQCDLKDVSYYIKKKQGFPSITDKGVMDIFLGGEGFSFRIKAANAHKTDRANFVKLESVDVTIKHLQIKIKQSNHKLLFSIAKSLLLKVMRPVIQKAIEKAIKDNFVKLDNMLYAIHKETQKAVDAGKNDPENAPNIYTSYYNSAQNYFLRKKEEAKKKSSDVKVNVAMTQHDSMFKQISLPGGVSTKATEYKNLAAKGDKWESPVFGIGSAKESTNLPTLAKVTRKPHNATKGAVRGGNQPDSGAASTSGSGMTGTTATGGQGYGSTGTESYGSGTIGGQNYGSGATGGQNYESGATGIQSYGSGATGGQNYGSGTTGAGAQGFGSQVDQAFSSAGPGASVEGTEIPIHSKVTK